jgi:hypothetical protein
VTHCYLLPSQPNLSKKLDNTLLLVSDLCDQEMILLENWRPVRMVMEISLGNGVTSRSLCMFKKISGLIFYSTEFSYF